VCVRAACVWCECREGGRCGVRQICATRQLQTRRRVCSGGAEEKETPTEVQNGYEERNKEDPELE